MFYQNKSNLQIKKNHGGFTLLEVLITMTVLSVGLLGLGRMHIIAVKGNMAAQEITDANNVALNNFEQLLSDDYTKIDHTVNPDKYPQCSANKAKLVHGKYIVCYEIQENDDTKSNVPGMGANTKIIKVLVRWYSQIGCQKKECIKIHPELNLKYNKERTMRYIIPMTDT